MFRHDTGIGQRQIDREMNRQEIGNQYGAL